MNGKGHLFTYIPFVPLKHIIYSARLYVIKYQNHEYIYISQWAMAFTPMMLFDIRLYVYTSSTSVKKKKKVARREPAVKYLA